MLIAARALQGVGGAFLVPGSLSLISASFAEEDRGAAVGAWSGLTGVSTAIGPFLGGWLVDAVSWRLVFLINIPLAAVCVWITLRHVPESHDPDATGHPDYLGAGTATVGLAGVVFALIEGPKEGWPAGIVLAGVIGVAALIAFPLIEQRRRHPLVPLGIFRSRQFSGANLTTFAVYAGLGVATFLLVLQLQTVLDYSAIEAGSALLPITVFMLLFSARFGRLAQRIGPRLPMTIGPFVVAFGLFLLSFVADGTSYWTGVLPAVSVLGFGLAITVAPLTAAVLAAVDDHHVGVASGVNNAVRARRRAARGGRAPGGRRARDGGVGRGVHRRLPDRTARSRPCSPRWVASRRGSRSARPRRCAHPRTRRPGSRARTRACGRRKGGRRRSRHAGVQPRCRLACTSGGTSAVHPASSIPSATTVQRLPSKWATPNS